MNKRKIKQLKFLQKVHIYGGLYIFPFFIVIGFSAIQLHHGFFDEDVWARRNHNYHINFDTSLSEDSLSAVLKDSIGIYGYDPYWKRWYDDSKNYHFKIERPGRTYNFTVNKTTKDISVEEQYKGLFSVMVGLHLGASHNPGSWVYTVWRVYTESVFVMIFLILAVSIYFWFKKSLRSKIEWILSIMTILLLTSYILYLWLVG